MDEMLVRAFFKSLLLPPLINIVLILAALLLLQRWRLLKNLLIGFSLLSLLLLSLPLVAHFLSSQLERYPPLQWQQVNAEAYQAIVVLPAGA